MLRTLRECWLRRDLERDPILDRSGEKFALVSADFAATEGEGDRSLAHWQRAHTAYFERECLRIGRRFTLEAPVLCETFSVVYGDRSS